MLLPVPLACSLLPAGGQAARRKRRRFRPCDTHVCAFAFPYVGRSAARPHTSSGGEKRQRRAAFDACKTEEERSSQPPPGAAIKSHIFFRQCPQKPHVDKEQASLVNTWPAAMPPAHGWRGEIGCWIDPATTPTQLWRTDPDAPKGLQKRRPVFMSIVISCVYGRNASKALKGVVFPLICVPESPEFPGVASKRGGRRDEAPSEEDRKKPPPAPIRWPDAWTLDHKKEQKTKRGYKPPAHPGPSTGRSCSK